MARDLRSPGSRPTGHAPTDREASPVDPSRGDLIRALQHVMKLDDLGDIYEVAQGALDRLPEARVLRLAQLSSDSAAVRYDAVNWLDRNRNSESLPALQAQYLVEDNKTVRALLKAVLSATAPQGIDAEGQDPKGLGAEHESPSAEGGAP